ncbi:hypothetical protein [Ligilactobacillus equi]
MSLYYLSEQSREDKRTAAGKPRKDAEVTLKNMGFEPIYLNDFLERNKLDRHIRKNIELVKIVRNLKKGDVFLIQHPLYRSPMYFLKFALKILRKKEVRTVVLIHDLDILRKSKDTKTKELLKQKWIDLATIREYSDIIVHNSRMKKYLEMKGIRNKKFYELQIFDYLTKDVISNSKCYSDSNVVVVAGNLDFAKAGYAYKLPDSLRCNLYGVNYEVERSSNGSNVEYRGAIEAENVSALKGSYGLVWDGTSVNTCSGFYGMYLKYNSPFKLSMYLSAGLPVIVWDESAEKEFVEKNKVGISVSDLASLNSKLATITENEYSVMKNNAIEVSEKLKSGYYLKRVITEICK